MKLPNPTQVRAVTSGPAVNIYINLKGREANGTVTPEEYIALQADLVSALQDLSDTNPRYVSRGRKKRVFAQVHARPLPKDSNDPTFGLGTSKLIGQDSGDVFATVALGYNFDGVQSPVLQRQGDEAMAAPVLSVPNFYGAHGYDPDEPEMSAIFFAAGPDVCGPDEIDRVHSIDIAPTILRLLDVKASETVQGHPIKLCRQENRR